MGRKTATWRRRSTSRAVPIPPDPPRLVIERLSPSVDGGRTPCKRILGDVLEVGADLFTDGHALMDARVRFRAPRHEAWRVAPMRYDSDSDRWYGEVELDAIGTWRYTVEGWVDRFATWARDLSRRLAAQQDIAEELLEGAALVRAAARLDGARPGDLEDAAKRLEDAGASVEERAELALSESLAAAMAARVPDEERTIHQPEHVVRVDASRALVGAWYELFPRSQTDDPAVHGTFRSAAAELDRIAELGFDVVYLPPIHPIGKTKRKGPNNALVHGPGDPGSPWAIGSEDGGHTAVHPDLGTIDDFDAFVARARDRGLEVALDYALQCSPDHPWAREHPDWFVTRPDGTIKHAENPPKKYEDIYPLDFWCADREGLWNACVDVLLFWIEHGVTTFRVDNPHTKPFAFWEWAIAEVQERHPDTVVLAEAFTRPKRMKGLAKIGFTQSYTYFTWKNTAEELREYLEELTQTEMAEYYRPNFFANTPDILHEYLQTGGRPAFRARLLLAATLSPSYGIYSGFELCENVPKKSGSEEYLDSEKYQLRPRSWDGAHAIHDDIVRINRIRREHPALRRLTNLTFHDSDNPNILFYRKSAPEEDLLVAVNLDPSAPQETTVHVPLEELGLAWDEPYQVEDLLTGHRYTWQGAPNYVRLSPTEEPGHVLRLAREGQRA